ncbi:single-stranded DNA-binding protein [Streptomyces sp. NBC_01571]|uniref:single-stranded DNA-binding protein n=1 Tax=Streptomyces sp. NBC_01571 TaxID=2975883 RepID=UPI002257A0A2|nr:single-stranded DNA-binding protein [Streptomyces sp. NBC_01571]MCX4581103.1 single-stranded DNA-binding protein [Streptomyces sp. NBC_01571]
MPKAPTVPFIGTVTGSPETRFTDSGIPVTRFRLTTVPSEWDAQARQWRDAAPIHYICTAWRDLARNAAESLVDGVEVIVHGRITGAPDSSILVSADEIGVSLRARIAYTAASLPPQAAQVHSPHVPGPPQPAVQPAASAPQPAPSPGQPPRWWEQKRAEGWLHPTGRQT